MFSQAGDADLLVMLWLNKADDDLLQKVANFGYKLAYFRAIPINAGQHVAHNEMLDECVRRGVDWHIRVDDDCWFTTRKWLKRLLSVQDKIKKTTKNYFVLGINVHGLNHPPKFKMAYEFGKEVIEEVEILGGIFRMASMKTIRYFRWDERLPMGFGEARQFSRFCDEIGIRMFRMRHIQCTHGDSTKKQQECNPDWDYEHDMLQYIPLGL